MVGWLSGLYGYFRGPRSHTCLLHHFLVGCLRSQHSHRRSHGPTRIYCFSFGSLAAWLARLFSGVGPYSFARHGLLVGLRRGCAERTNLVVGSRG